MLPAGNEQPAAGNLSQNGAATSQEQESRSSVGKVANYSTRLCEWLFSAQTIRVQVSEYLCIFTNGCQHTCCWAGPIFRIRLLDKNVDALQSLLIFSTAAFVTELFHLPTLMHNSLFINNMYVTLLSSTCFEH